MCAAPAASPATPPALARVLLPWHHDHWQRLLTAERQQRLGHAWLFTGMSGVGKRHFADLLTQALLCRQPQPDGTPCNQCSECHLVCTAQHPDHYRVMPDADSASGEIKVDAIRELTAYATLTPHRAPRKVIQLVPAEAMNRVAANSLLKTLEEPAASTLLLLIADDASRLPATVRSRCQRLVFTPPASAIALPWLTQQFNKTPAAAPQLLLQLAHGAPLQALALANSELLTTRRAVYQTWLAVANGQHDPLAAAAQWQQLDVPWLLLTVASWLLDLMRVQAAGAAAVLTNSDQRNELTGYATRLAPLALHQCLRQVFTAQRLAHTALNKQLLLETVLIHWAQFTAPARGNRHVRR